MALQKCLTFAETRRALGSAANFVSYWLIIFFVFNRGFFKVTWPMNAFEGLRLISSFNNRACWDNYF
jgi:hypothetical protein